MAFFLKKKQICLSFQDKLVPLQDRYKQAPFWYQDSKYVNKAFLEDDVMEKAMKDASKEDVIILDMKSHERSISPAWRAMEFFSFGATISLYFYSKNLKYSLKYLQLSEIIPIFAASNVCLAIRVESREGQVLLITPLEQGITILLHF